MKKFLSLVLVTTLIISCNAKTDQQESFKQGTAVAIAVDVTDPKALWVVPTPILSLYNLEAYPDGEAWFQTAIISDLKLNPTSTLHLPAGTETERQNTNDDPQFRGKQILNFYKDIKNSIGNIYKQFDTAQSRDYSECFQTICNQLQWLVKQRCRNRILAGYTDLMEKSSIVNTYRFLAGGKAPQLINIFNQTSLLPSDLHGIKVVFVFEPRNRKEDSVFNTMISIYKALIESRGGLVVVQANNQKFTL